MEPVDDTVIEFRHATVTTPRAGLSAVSFALKKGETYAWLGGPGSGKTQVLDLVMGFRRPDLGTVLVFGHDPAADTRAVRLRVSFVDGRARLPGPMTPVQGLVFLASLSSGRADAGTCVNALRVIGLPDRYFGVSLDALPAAAHLGVSLALALMRSTEMLVLDDPTRGLDSVATAQVIDALAAFRRRGTAILLTTSDVLVAASVADHVGILKGGAKVAERHRQQLAQASLSALYADYVGRDHGRDRTS